ncbi:response regulator [Streptomyces sp. NPDC018019]|uniref:response regulator n=1 Tax=Streptomyces sp. NPDC018019 TaxID=3365030 RepID=UPI0037939D1F
MPGDRDIRVLASDDHCLLRSALCELLDMAPGITVVGQADDGPSTVALATALRPDLVLLDVEMPGSGPHATLGELLRAVPGVRVVVLTMHSDRALVDSLLAAGAAGFVHKGVDQDALVAAMRSVMTGGRVTCLQGAGAGSASPVEEPSGLLTAREREVLECVAKAMSNRQIGRRLAITEGTVKRHLRNIFGKLGATSRLDAVNKGLGRGPAELRRTAG